MTKIPEYRKIYSELKREIKSGTYSPGMFLPTETELENMFGVSRTTIRKAISLLVLEGFISVQQGRGTEVQEVSTSQRLNQITSFSETLSQKGYIVTTRGFYLEHIPAPAFVREALGLEKDCTVHHLQRVQCADGRPICIMENYISAHIIPDFEIRNSNFVSLYELLEHEYNLVLREAVERITAIGASFTESQILLVPSGTPLLFSKRITYCDKGPFEYVINKVLAEQYEYVIHLSGRA